jgi:hypothetical protein
MTNNELYNEIVGQIQLIRHDKDKLETLLEFVNDQLIYDASDELEEIPEKFELIIKNVAGSIDCGSICYINTDTAEVEEYHPDMAEYEEEFADETPEFELKYKEWPNSIAIEPLEASESFEIMSGFALQIGNIVFQNKLLNILEGKKPFANFKRTIDSSNYRQAWFDYKQKALENHVRTQLYLFFKYKTGTPKATEGIRPNDLPF